MGYMERESSMGLAARQRFRKESLGGKEENLMENSKDLTDREY